MEAEQTRLQDYFEEINDQELRGWLTYLHCQAELFSKRELEVLRQLGFGDNGGVVLDLGCGPGVFTRKLAEAVPGNKVLGADANPEFVNLFRKSLETSPVASIEVCEWLVGTAECPPLIAENQPSDVLARLVLQHVREPEEFLQMLKESFKPGTRLFIIEEDDGLYLNEPKFTGLERVLGIYQKWADEVGSTRQVGRNLPRLAAKVGLKLKSLDIICHTSTNLGLRNLLEYYRTSVADMPPDVYTAEEAADIAQSLADYADNYEKTAFVFYPQVFCVLEV